MTLHGDALRVLVASADPAACDAIAARLARDPHRYRLSIARTAAHAMKAGPFDVLVAGGVLADADAAELLGWTKRNRPASARILLAAHAEGLAAVRRTPAAQNHLDPSDAAGIRAAIERTVTLNRLLLDPLARRAVHAQAMPKCYVDLTVAGAVASYGEAARLRALARDDRQASEFARELPERADGVETLRATVIAAHCLRPLAPAASGELTFERLRERAIRRSEIVAAAAPDAVRDAACAAALLADIGVVALAESDATRHRRAHTHAHEKSIGTDCAERLVLGIDHGEAGAIALGGWSLPFEVLEAIAYHHRPALVTEGDRRALALVHLADHAVDGTWGELDRAFLAAAGFSASPCPVSAVKLVPLTA